MERGLGGVSMERAFISAEELSAARNRPTRRMLVEHGRKITCDGARLKSPIAVAEVDSLLRNPFNSCGCSAVGQRRHTADWKLHSKSSSTDRLHTDFVKISQEVLGTSGRQDLQ